MTLSVSQIPAILRFLSKSCERLNFAFVCYTPEPQLCLKAAASICVCVCGPLSEHSVSHINIQIGTRGFKKDLSTFILSIDINAAVEIIVI